MCSSGRCRDGWGWLVAKWPGAMGGGGGGCWDWCRWVLRQVQVGVETGAGGCWDRCRWVLRQVQVGVGLGASGCWADRQKWCQQEWWRWCQQKRWWASGGWDGHGWWDDTVTRCDQHLHIMCWNGERNGAQMLHILPYLAYCFLYLYSIQCI
jgi:hypothetical protein